MFINWSDLLQFYCFSGMKGQQQAKIIIIHQYNQLNLNKFLNPTLKSSIQPFPKIYKRSGHQRYLFNIQEIINGKSQSYQRDCCDIVYQERHRMKTEIDVKKQRRLGLDSISLPKRESCNKTSCIASRSLSKAGTPRHSSQKNRNTRLQKIMFEPPKVIEQNKLLSEFQQLRESQTRHKIYQSDSLLKNSSEQRIKNLIPIVNQTPESSQPNQRKYKLNVKDESCQTQSSPYYLTSSKQNLLIKPVEQIYQTPNAKKRMNNQGLSDSKISKEELQQNLGKITQKSESKTAQKKVIRKQSSEEDNKSNSIIESGGKVSSTIFHKIKQSVTKSAKKLLKQSTQKAYSVMSNGLFRIPEQDEFQDYLKGYKPLNPTFDIRQLVQSQNFHIVPTNNNVYFGEVIDRKKSGKGITVSEKQIFEGAYRENSKISGSQKNRDGVYTGEFLKGKRHGKGKFIWNNGQTFQGEWRNGKKNGSGLWRSPRGDYYEGQWKDNRQNGNGYYVYFGGSKYRGQFKDFLKHGQGDQTFANGDRYTGQYQFGKPHGEGRYIWANGDYYDGQFINGSRQGRGKLVRKSGLIYEGQFKNDDKNGLGTQKNTKTGQIFQGQFHNGQRYQKKLKQKDTHELSINHK